MNSTCPECDSDKIYQSKEMPSSGGYGPYPLKGIGGFFCSATMSVVLCADCGLMRYYASRDACDKLPDSSLWSRVESKRER